MPSTRTRDDILNDFIQAWDKFEDYLQEVEKQTRPAGYTTNMVPASIYDALKAEVDIYRGELFFYDRENDE
jgi:hypothetical protein